MYEIRIYELAAKIAKRAHDLVPDNKEIKDLYDDARKFSEEYRSLEKLLQDELIVGPLKGPIYYFWYGSEMDEKEFEKSLEENFKAIDNYIKNNSSDVIISVRRIEIFYPKLYKYKSDTYRKIPEVAVETKTRRDQ